MLDGFLKLEVHEQPQCPGRESSAILCEEETLQEHVQRVRSTFFRHESSDCRRNLSSLFLRSALRLIPAHFLLAKSTLCKCRNFSSRLASESPSLSVSRVADLPAGEFSPGHLFES